MNRKVCVLHVHDVYYSVLLQVKVIIIIIIISLHINVVTFIVVMFSFFMPSL